MDESAIKHYLFIMRQVRELIGAARHYLAVDSLPDMVLESAEILLNDTLGPILGENGDGDDCD